MKHEKIPMSCQKVCEQVLEILKTHGSTIQINQTKCVKINSKKHYVIKTVLISFNGIIYPNNSNEIVIKMFNKRISNHYDRWFNEINRYSQLKLIFGKLSLPNLIYSCPGLIIYNFINAKTYHSLLMNQNLSNYSIEILANWFFTLHSQGLVFGDARLLNFLFTKEKRLIVTDFEDIHKEDPIRDVSNLLSSFIDNFPGIFEDTDVTYQLERMIYFLKSYLSLKNTSNSKYNHFFNDLDKFASYWCNKIIESLKIVADRRSKKIKNSRWFNIQKLVKEAILKYYFKD